MMPLETGYSVPGDNVHHTRHAGQNCVPFQHQAEAFRLVANDQEVFLVAGTAAGKTLAIAVPLFEN
jgi:ATP-dependent helicase YprA (DUF1998 family)